MKESKKYRLLATDLDETILSPEPVLSEYAVSVLRAIEEMGVKVVICTGRAYAGALLYLKQIGLNNPGIFCNGAQVRGSLDGSVLHECPLPIEDARLAIRLGEETGGHPRVYMDDRIYVSSITEEDKTVSSVTHIKFEAVGDLCSFLDRPPLKMINYMKDPELVPVLLEKNERVLQGRLYITQSMWRSTSIFVEYMNVSATKGNGLKKIADMWGISKDEIIVAGDYLNDLTMFAEAGFSIAPQNAHPSVREAASVVCLSNAEDGVAKKFAEIFLS
ncbi:MAG: Cof-type HAD-IIB family hydrolase [Synergistaceae bacterium]|nr:Cof-type HAD-IIB family hydrolase [Synergistaceae bacterium]